MKHIQFIRYLSQLQFSGQLIRTHASKQQWSFYFCKGAILYATGGTHTTRRWVRYINAYCPEQATQTDWYSELADMDTRQFEINWEYALLNQWLSNQKITQKQAAQIIHSILIEILFDIEQTGEVTDQIQQKNYIEPQIECTRLEKITANAQMRWQTWQAAKLSGYSPQMAPVIRHAEALQQYSSPEIYQTLTTLLNGQNTLLDLAMRMQRNVTEVTTSLLPFIQRNWIELTQIPDLPAPVAPSIHIQAITTPPSALVACVDDSFLVRHLMEKLITSAGYEFLGVEDAVRSIGILLARKPDLIFLDLMMPNANGHEICAQLRKLSCFRDTPIVILTGSDGFANRLRSNFVGASDFLSKPLNSEAVLSVIRKHLEHPRSTHLSVPVH